MNVQCIHDAVLHPLNQTICYHKIKHLSQNDLLLFSINLPLQ